MGTRVAQVGTLERREIARQGLNSEGFCRLFEEKFFHLELLGDQALLETIAENVSSVWRLASTP